MYSILFLSDLHLHERAEFSQITESGLNSRFEEGLSILDQVVELAKEKKIKHIVHLGDIFELKDKIPGHMLVEFSNRLGIINDLGIEFISLKGNHDFKLEQYSSAKVLKNMLFIDEVRSYELEEMLWIVFIPFMRDYQEFKKVWEELHEKDIAGAIICFHQELPGVWYNEEMHTEGVFGLSLQEDVLYLGGHIHEPQIIHKKINYLGSPYFTSFGEKGKRFVYMLNEDLTLIPYQLNYPKFIQVDFNERKGKILPYKNNYFQITGTVDPSLKSEVLAFKDFLLNRGAKNVSLKVKYLLETKTRIKTEKITEREILNEFIKIITTDLDKEKLEQTGIDILGGM